MLNRAEIKISANDLVIKIETMIEEGKSLEECRIFLHLLKGTAFREGFSEGYNAGFSDKNLPF